MKKPSKQKFARLYAGRKTSFWNKLTGRKHHRLSASVTGESDWEVETPQIRMSRAFAILLVLHVIAVGGLFAYRIWGRDEDPQQENAMTVPPAPLEEGTAAISAPRPVPEPPAAPAEPAELKTYTVRAGDSIQLIAARFEVTTAALREANPDKVLVPGTELVLPRAGRVFDGPALSTPAGGAAAIFDPHATLTALTPAPEPPAPRALAVPEDAEIPDVVPAPAEEAAPAEKPAMVQSAVKEQPKVADSKKPREVKEKPRASSSPAAPAVLAATPVKQPQTVKQPARLAGQRVHVVAKGDTVYNLARRYGFTADEIARANGLGADYRITLGQQLKVPVKR